MSQHHHQHNGVRDSCVQFAAGGLWVVRIDFMLSVYEQLKTKHKYNKIPFLPRTQINSKYSEELAAESLEWIKEITAEPINTSGDTDNFFEVLKDGVLLCKLINCIKPGSIKRVNDSKMAFKCMENITAFLDHAKQLGVPPQETFQSVDLWERQNLNSVVICLQSLGRKVRVVFCFGFICVVK